MGEGNVGDEVSVWHTNGTFVGIGEVLSNRMYAITIRFHDGRVMAYTDCDYEEIMDPDHVPANAWKDDRQIHAEWLARGRSPRETIAESTIDGVRVTAVALTPAEVRRHCRGNGMEMLTGVSIFVHPTNAPVWKLGTWLSSSERLSKDPFADAEQVSKDIKLAMERRRHSKVKP